jgi:hypothetical protein
MSPASLYPSPRRALFLQVTEPGFADHQWSSSLWASRMAGNIVVRSNVLSPLLQMGQGARSKIETHWNLERAFTDVFKRIND